MNILICEKITKKFGTIQALKNISLEVKRGEIFGFLGPNGAGKSTAINILATILKPTSGKAYLTGYDIIKKPYKARENIGIIFQDPSFYVPGHHWDGASFCCYFFCHFHCLGPGVWFLAGNHEKEN